MSLYRTAFRTTLRIHHALYQRTDGLIGHNLFGTKALMLRTTGRRSGQVRTNSLTYAKDGERWIVVASKGGDPAAPAWLHNLRANPEVEVQVGRRKYRATATEITHDDPDFPRLWKLVNDNNAGRYDAYQKQTARPIPLVALAPRS
jgi:deazaflavin-dependent oxidoreductase (nitroreductase family)